MMQKTHLVIALFFIMILLPFIEYKISFFLVTLFFSIVPDIDTSNSRIGRSIFLRLFQFFTKHRGILHSLTFAVFLSVLAFYFIPFLAIPLFLGFSIHLVLDSLTIEGIKPFWPFDFKIKGPIRTNSILETITFILFCFIDVILVVTFTFEILGI